MTMETIISVMKAPVAQATACFCRGHRRGRRLSWLDDHGGGGGLGRWGRWILMVAVGYQLVGGLEHVFLPYNGNNDTN